MVVLIFSRGERALNFRHSGLGHHLSIGCCDVSLHFLDRKMAAYSHNLRGAGARFGEPPASGLPQPMRPAGLRQARFLAAIREPVPEACRCKRLAMICDQEGEMAAGRGLDQTGQVNMDRNCDLCSCLFLCDGKGACANVLGAGTCHVASPLQRVQKQAERQAGFRADWMPLFKLLDLRLIPSVESRRTWCLKTDAVSRILRKQPSRYCVLAKPSDSFQPVACRKRLAFAEYCNQRASRKLCDSLVAMILAKQF